MTRPITLPRSSFWPSVALVGFAACSSDSNKTSVEELIPSM